MTVGSVVLGPGVDGTNLIRRFQYNYKGRRTEIAPRYVRPLRQKLTHAVRQAVAEARMSGYRAVAIEGVRVTVRNPNG